jgi:hypothetical protein
VLDADSFDIAVRPRVRAATTTRDVAFGHTSRLTHRQHLAFPEVSTNASMRSTAYAGYCTAGKTVLNRHHLLQAKTSSGQNGHTGVLEQ